LNDYRKLGSQALIYGLGNIVPRLLNYAVLTAYYSRRFSVEEYGIITELYAYVAILLVILTYGMETGMFKFSSGSYSKSIVYTTALISVSITSFLFLLAILVFKSTIAYSIGYEGNNEYIFYLGATVAFDAIAAIMFAKLRIDNRVREFAILKIFNVLITIFLIFLFLELLPSIKIISNSIWYRLYFKDIEVGYVFIANVLASLFVLLLLLKKIQRQTHGFDLKILWKLLKYSVPLLIAGLAGIFNETIDRILIRRFLSEKLNPLYELGIYGANYRIAILLTIFVQMFRYAAEPFFFNLYKGSRDKEVAGQVLKYFVIFMMAIFLFVALGIDFFKYFIDKRFHEGLGIVPIVLLANVLIGILFNLNMWYKLTGMTIYGVYITGIGALITVFLNVLYIPNYGYFACAWIHLLSNLIMVILTYFMGQKFYRIEYPLGRIFLYIITALLLYFIGTFLKSVHTYINIILAGFAVVFYLWFCNKKERLFLIFFGKKHENSNC
jgi:O-antigen/teichoic acid export membrane protein